MARTKAPLPSDAQKVIKNVQSISVKEIDVLDNELPVLPPGISGPEIENIFIRKALVLFSRLMSSQSDSNLPTMVLLWGFIDSHVTSLHHRLLGKKWHLFQGFFVISFDELEDAGFKIEYDAKGGLSFPKITSDAH